MVQNKKGGHSFRLALLSRRNFHPVKARRLAKINIFIK